MDRFQQRKNSLLGKTDKSFRGMWDERVLGLCEKINDSEKYYTTSSCSGRIMVVKDQDRKSKDVFRFISHDLVNYEEFCKYLPGEKAKSDLKFKQESFILHVACRDLEAAKNLMQKALKSGWKRVGILSLGKNIIVEITGTEKIDFPLMKKGNLLVSDKFMQEVLEKANSNLKRGWIKIERLVKEFK